MTLLGEDVKVWRKCLDAVTKSRTETPWTHSELDVQRFRDDVASCTAIYNAAKALVEAEALPDGPARDAAIAAANAMPEADAARTSLEERTVALILVNASNAPDAPLASDELLEALRSFDVGDGKNACELLLSRFA